MYAWTVCVLIRVHFDCMSLTCCHRGSRTSRYVFVFGPATKRCGPWESSTGHCQSAWALAIVYARLRQIAWSLRRGIAESVFPGLRVKRQVGMQIFTIFVSSQAWQGKHWLVQCCAYFVHWAMGRLWACSFCVLQWIAGFHEKSLK